MGSCSVWIYIDATSMPVKIRYESTCEKHYKCDGKSCTMVDTSSHTFHDEIKVGSLDDVLPLTPSNPSIWQPFPPFKPVDANVVVDSDPRVEVYGLPYRKSTVITLIKRSILEGYSQLQLIRLSNNDVVLSESEALVDGWLGFELNYPLLPKPSSEELNINMVCHMAGNIEAWGSCLYEYYTFTEHLQHYINRIAQTFSRRRYGADLVAMLTRLYAGLAVASGFKPLELAETLISHDTIYPLLIKDEKIIAIHPNLKIGLKCTEKDLELFGRAGKILDLMERYGCDSISLICKRCWQSLTIFREKTA
jgi:hypothetical protein